MSAYVGRFAPTPSGPLHFGSLVTAVAGWMQARMRQGKWLLRMDDLDTDRVDPLAGRQILFQLEQRGLCWDGEVLWQSSRREAYRQGVDQLRQHLFWCACSRKKLREQCGGIHTAKACASEAPCHLLRVEVAGAVGFVDRVMGEHHQDLVRDVGAFTLVRYDRPQPYSGRFTGINEQNEKDAIYSYHLANVLDDDHSGINEIVRGADLRESAPRQIYLQKLLGFSRPDYLHVPAIVNAEGIKLSKQTGAASLRAGQEARELVAALQVLGQSPPATLCRQTVQQILTWGLANWHPEYIPTVATLPDPVQ